MQFGNAGAKQSSHHGFVESALHDTDSQVPSVEINFDGIHTALLKLGDAMQFALI